MHRWLKGWDRCVFDREAPGGNKRSNGQDKPALQLPEQRILLLSGPPGDPLILHALGRGGVHIVSTAVRTHWQRGRGGGALSCC